MSVVIDFGGTGETRAFVEAAGADPFQRALAEPPVDQRCDPPASDSADSMGG